ncbi:MAG: hypothetical protein L0229_21435, partial [Blastocatellia bacterium]|nr:hypothetical protein [Blastocatellia bacterium]
LLAKSPILDEYALASAEELDEKLKNTAAACIGEMRFYVMMKDSTLYAEIDSQISRFRLVRILFLVELILFIAIIWQWHRGLGFILKCSVPLAIIAFFNLIAIGARFNRYCRAVERTYKAIMLDQP